MASKAQWFESSAGQRSREQHHWLRWPWSFFMSACEPVRLRQYRREVEQIAVYSAAFREDDAVVQQTLASERQALRYHLLSNQGDREILLKTMGLLEQACARSVGIRPYDVQLIAVLAMIDGHFVQLAPGEGKTLTIALVAIINAFLGRPCHVMTANSYLAVRDAELMSPLFQFCGLEAVTLDDDAEREARALVYAHDIVYGTAQQFLADYLRDQLALGAKLERIEIRLANVSGRTPIVSMRGLGSAIIDEADSILVDEANTPLIISGPVPDPMLFEAVKKAHVIVQSLNSDQDYQIDKLFNAVSFDENAWQRICGKRLLMPGPWRNEQRFEHLLKQAVLAREVYRENEHFIVEEEKVVIVDERTGRQMPNRSWSKGLHQAVECEVGVPLSDPTETVERMSFQNFFCRYERLTGASGTLQNLERELALVYGRALQRIPTRMPLRRQMHAPKVYLSAHEKWQSIVDDVLVLHRARRPVLIGTRCVEDSERIGQLLTEAGVDVAILNAKYPADEADIIAKAGQFSQVTVATNMAGRGTDIYIDPAVEAAGGLVVMLTEPHSAARVDWQLYGRGGRQGQAGEAYTYVSAEDVVLISHLPAAKYWLKRLWKIPKWRRKSAPLLIRWAQARAQRRALSQRQQLNRADRRWRDSLSFAARR